MYDLQRWQLSPERLYQECWIRHFLREEVDPAVAGDTCNVGIGLGEFDDFLGYWLLGHGGLVSVDIDEQQVRSLSERQQREGHPNPARVVHADLLQATLGPFDLVTIVGSTLHETHAPARAIRCASEWVRPGGLLYATIIHDLGDPERLLTEIGGRTLVQRTYQDLPGAELTAVICQKGAASS